MDDEPTELTEAELSEMAQFRPPAPIPPMPMPLAVGVSPAVGQDQTSWVVLSFNTPQGENIFWLDRENAKAIASKIRKIAETGPELEVVRPHLFVPGA